MKKLILTAGISMLFTAICILAIFEIRAQNRSEKADDLLTINSQVLDEQREILIHLPASYHHSPDQSYPLLLAFDGSSLDHKIVQVAQTLSAAGVMPEIIIAGIPNSDRNRDLTPDYLHQDLESKAFGAGSNFLLFLREEVLPKITDKYRCNDYRLLAGHSRGGLMAFEALLEQPDLFNAYFCFSPAFWREDHAIVAHTVSFLQQQDTLDHFIHLSLGTEENEKMTAGFVDMTQTLEALERPGLHWLSQYTEGADHQSNPQLSLPLALRSWATHFEWELDVAQD